MVNSLGFKFLTISPFFINANLIHIPKNSYKNDAVGNRILSYPLKSSLPHERLRRAQTTNSTSDITESSLYLGFGTHYIEIFVGYPNPKLQTLIVDTGSDLTAFPCATCFECGKKHNADGYFDESKSETYEFSLCGQCAFGSCGEDDLGERHRRKRKLAVNKNIVQVRSNKRLLGYYDYDGDNQCHVTASYEEGSKWHAIESEDWVFLDLKSSTRFKQNNFTSSAESNDDERLLLRGVSNRKAAELKSMVKNDTMFATEVSRAKTLTPGRTSSLGHSETSTEPPDDDKRQFRLKFACQYELKGLFKSQLADGITGMDRSKYSLWYQMFEEGVIHKKQFSLCFAPIESLGAYKTHAGVISMGGTNENLHKSQMTYAVIMDGSPWYTIYVKAIYLELPRNSTNEDGNLTHQRKVEKLDLNATRLNSGEIIFDSGTTDIYMPKLMKRPFYKAWEKLMGGEYDPNQEYSDKDTYPNILIQMQGEAESEALGGSLAKDLDLSNPGDAIYTIPPKHYMSFDEKLPFRMDEKEGDGAVLGAYAMMGNDILFDMEKKRVGFANSDCQFDSV